MLSPSRLRLAALAAAMMAAAAAAFAAGTKSSGNSVVRDDLTGGSAGSVLMSAGGTEVEGTLGQTAVGAASLGLTESSGGFFAPAVTAPVNVAVSGVDFSSITLGWSDATPANPVGTEYVAELSTAPDFTGALVSSRTTGFVVTVASLAANATHYIRIRAEFGGTELSDYVFLSTASAIETPTAVYFDEISSNSITASAYASGTAFSSMTAGFSGTVVALEGAYSAWRPSGWTARANLSQRYGAATAVLDGRLYAVGGNNFGKVATNESYDPVSNLWTGRAAMGTARDYLGLAAVGGRLYAYGGSGMATTVPYNEEYDPESNSWRNRRSLITQRWGLAYAAANGKAYAIGGTDSGSLKSTEEYDPETDTWTARGDLVAPRHQAGAAVVDGKVYLAGGVSSAALEVFDPGTGAWSARTGMRYQRQTPGVAAVGGKLYALGGFSSGYVTEVEEYDPSADTWTARGPMLRPRADFSAAALGGRVYAVAGYNGSTMNNLDAYDPGVAAKFDALAPNKLFGFTAKARNVWGVETDASPSVSTYTLAAASVPRAGEPRFSDLTASSVTVNWSSGTDAGGFNGPGAYYLAQMSTMATFMPVWQSSQTYALSARLTGFMTQTTHYFRVRAYNSVGVTDHSWTVLGSTRADSVPPNPPGEVLASLMGSSNTLRVRWRTPGNDGATGVLPAGSEFRVQWATGPFATVDWSTANAQVVISTGPLDPGVLVSTDVAHLPQLTTATFRVWASDDFGNWSLASGSAPMSVSPFSYEKVTGDGISAGESAGMAMDRLGNMHVVYKDATLPGLKYVKREAGVWQAPTTAFPGTYSSIVAAVDPDGAVHVAYYNQGLAELAYARYDGSWSSAAVHALTNGSPGGIAVDPRGLVMISYSDYSNGDLRFARGSGKNWVTEAVDTAGQPNNGVPSSLALDASGNPRIAYTLPTGGSAAYNLKYAARGGDGLWTVSEVRPQAENLSQPNLVLDRDGLPRITYYRYSTVDSVFYVADTGSGFISPVLIGKTANGLNSATMDGNGGLHVAFYVQPGDDLAYSYSGDGGASWSSHTVDMDGLVGYPVQPIVVDGNGAVHIVYHDQSNVDIKAARWEPGAFGAAFGGKPGSAVQAPTAFDGHALGASSIAFRWIDGASNELGYRLYLSSMGSVNEAFSLAVGSSALGPVSGVGSQGSVNLTNLTANTSYQAYVAAVGNGGVVLSSASKIIYMPIEAPTAVLFEDVSSRSITAAAYAPTPAFSSMTAGMSGTNVALGADFQGWRVERWTAKANMPTSRRALAAAALGGKVYALAGVGGSGTLNQEFDPVANAWAVRAPMSTVREAPAAASVGGKIYVVGGWTGSAYTAVTEEYDPVADAWRTKAAMPLARYKLMAVAVGGRLHAIGGFNGAWRTNNHSYDPAADVWTSSAPMLTARGAAVAVSLGGKVHVIGGDNDSHLAVNEAFDPGTDSWSTKAPAPTARSAGAGAVAGGKAFVFGGWAGGSSFSGVEEYDAGSDTWAARASMPTARREVAAAAAGGRIYVLGGVGGGVVNEEFDPGTASSFTALTPNTQYSFRAKARNSFGTETVETAVFSTYTLAAATMPLAGTDLFSDVFATSMTVHWSSGTAEGGFNGPGATYLVQASTVVTFLPVAGSSLTADVSATVEGLFANTTHFVRVLAYNAANVTDHSWVLLGSTLTAIEAPTTVVIDAVSTRSVTAVAYAGTPGFSNMSVGLSGSVVAIDGSYAGGHGEKWTGRTALTTARYSLAAVTVGGKLYAIGGRNGGAFHATNEVYDPVSNAWSPRTPMPTARQWLAAAVSGGKIYAIGGTDGAVKTANEEYDPAADAWTPRAPLPVAREGLAAVAVGSRVFVLGGNGALNANTEYDPGRDVWTSKAALPSGRAYMAAATAGGKVYAVGGLGATTANEEYNPATNVWAVRAPLPTGRYLMAGASVGGKVYVIGGTTGVLQTNEEYDPATNQWATRTPMPTARNDHAAAALGGRVYAVGGFAGGALSANEEFDPGTASSFTALSPNTQYSFKGRARNSVGMATVESATVSTYTLAAATVPQGGASPFQPVYSTSMTVSWSSGTDAGGYNGPGASYLVEDSTMASFAPVSGSSLTFDTTAVVAGLTANATHYLRVRPYNSGGMPDDWFNLGSTVTLANPALSAASTFTMVGLTSMTVAWDANSNAAGTRYDVVFTTYFPFNNVVTVSTTPFGTPSATGTALLPNATYYPIVFVFNRAGVSSAETPLGSTATRIETPSTVLVTVVTSHSVVAVASSPVGAFSNLDQSSSAVNIARDDVYQDWVAGSSVTVSSGLTPNTLYSFKAKARNLQAVETDETTAVSTYTLAFATVPAAGASPFSAVFESSVAIHWASGTPAGGFNGPGATYRVEASTTPTFLTVHASSTTAFATATVTGLSWRNTTFYFRVTAFNAVGANDGAWTLLGATATPVEVPTSVEFLSVSSDAVVAVASAAGTGFSNLSLGTSAVNIALNTVYQGWVVGSSVTVSSGLVPNTLYTFKARARGVAGLETAESGAFSTRTLAAVPQPGAPGVYETFVTSASVQWTANNNPNPATEYRVHASTAEDFNAGASSTVVAWVTSLSTQVTGLIPYTTWHFRVQARNTDGRESDYAVLGSTVPLLFRVRPIEGSAADTRDLVWGDFDRDGDLDLAAAVYNGGGEFVLRDDGAGPVTYVPVTGTAGDSLGVAWGDYDGDGDLDLAIANDVGQNEVIGRNDGGSFTAVTLSGTAGNSSAVAWGDYDRDGDLDLAVANQGTQDEVILRNDGGGTFFKITVAGSGRDSKGLAWGDFDGDGDLDLLVANSGGQNETLLRYDGGTSFAVVDLTGTGGNTRSVAAADFDGDGDLDFAAANELNDDYVARNDGTGSFARTDFQGTGGYSHKAAWGDYDGDGDLDLAVSNYNGAEKYLARNTAGAFSTITVFGSAGAGWGLAWGDSDQDGLLDLAVGESGTDAYLLINKGGVVNSSPMAPGAPAYSLAYGVSGTTLTVSWPPSFDAETSTGVLSYALVAATAPMTLSGDGRRIVSPSGFLVSWNYGSPLFGANTRPQSALRLDLGGLAGANLKSDSTFYFRLQTVDAGLARSSWSVESSTFVYKDLPPQGRTLAQVNASSISVTYAGVGATQYFVEASTTDFVGGVSVSSATLSTGAVVLAPQGLSPNTTYFLRMGGLWQRTTSYAAAVPASTATLANAPATAVTTFTAVYVSSFNVAWSSNSNPASTQYRLEASTAADWSGLGDILTGWFTGPSTSAVGLTPNATTYVRVQARNHSGLETEWTALGSTVTGAAKPAPPAGSSFTVVGQSSVTLAWGLGTNPADTQFQVRASTASDFSGVDSFSAWLAAQTTTLSGLTADTTYHWRVTARNHSGLESEPRDFGAQATAPYEPAASSAPFHDTGSSSATVQWRPNGNPAGTFYEAQLSTSAAFGGDVRSSGWVAFLSTTVAGLTGDSTYYLRARARGVGGAVTGWTALASSPTLAADPDTLAAASVGPGSLRAEWPSMGNREAASLGPWAARTSLPAALERHGAALLNGRLYVVGGVKGGSPTSEVWSAGVSPSGTLGAWRGEAGLPAPRESPGLAAFGGRLYVVGGFDGSARSTVYVAEVSPDGRIAGWNTDSSLPAARSKLAVVAHGGWLYAIGGDNGVVSQSTVYRTPVDAKGKLVGWAAAAALPAARNGHAAAVAGGRVYVAGGLGAGVEEEVWSASLAGPTVGPWTVETPLPVAVFRHALLASGGALVSVGGHDGTGAVAAVRSARLLPGGSVGAWESLEPLPAGRFGHGAALETGSILVAGGADDSAAATDSYQAALGGTEYLLERAQDGGFSVDYASSNWRSGAGAELAGLTPNTVYMLRLRVRSRAGAEGALVVSASTRTPAAVPASAASTFSLVEAGSMTLTWASGGNPPGTEFLAAVSTSLDFTASLNTGWVAAVSSAVFGLTPNTSYYAGVVARDAAGNNTREVYLGSTVTAAAVPESATFPTVVTTGLSVEWSTAGNPSGTLYEAQLAAAASFSPLAASTVTTSTGTAFTGLLSATTYYLRVRAYNRLATPTGFSPTTSAVTGADFTAPAAAGGLGLHATDTSGVLLAAWTSPGDDGGAGVLPAGSRVYFQWSAADPATVAWSTANAQLSAATGPVTPGAPASLIVTGLPVGSSVYARVWTLDESDNVSAPSAVASVWASPFTLTRLDGSGQDAGRWASVALDRQGGAHAAYTGGTITQELRYMTRSGGVWSVAEAPDPGIPADEVVLAMGPSYPQVAYRNSTTGQLRLAKRASGWSAAAVASGNLHPGGLAVDATSYAHISYFDEDGVVGLRYARWNGASWDLETVDAGAGRGRFSSLALDGASAPHIAYYDATAGDLKYASRTAAGTWSVSTVEAAVDAGSVPVVALDGNGHASIAYVDYASKDLKLARYDGTAWSLSPIDTARDVTGVRGLTLDAAGRPVVTYYDGTNGDLLLGRYNGSGWETGAVDSYGDVGAWSGAALEADGSVLELHYDAGSADLKAGTWNAGLPAPLAGNPRGRLQAPAAFSGVVASSVSIQWTWVDSAASELGWRLYGATASTGPFSVVAGTAALASSAGTGTQRFYTETGLTAQTTYYRYVVAVASGGVVPSPMAALFPFDTVDVTSPTATDNQAGDLAWRRSSGTLYDVDFQDAGGSALAKFQVKAATVPGGAGPDVVGYTDVVVNILADNYNANWALPAAVFNALHDGATNYVTVRVFDGAGNSGVLTDAFTVLKDTMPPTLADNQAGDAVRRAVGGTLYDVDALDPASGLERFQYSVSTTLASGDAARVGWTDIPLVAGATSFAADWAVDFAALLGDSPNYVSVRAWDRAGSTATLTDAFSVMKDTGGPRVAVTAPAAAFRSVLTVLAGTAADDGGVGGVQVAVQTAPPTGNWFDGATFTAGGPFWLAASGTTTWTFAGVPAWTDGGAFRVVVRATDTLGNLSVAYSTADFTFDSSTPTAGVTSPAGGATLAVLANLAGTASDPGAAASGLARIDVQVRRAADGFYWGWAAGAWAAGESSTSPAVSATWSLALPEGLRSTLAHGASYFVSARAVDGAVPGNAGSLVSGSTFSWTDTVAPSAVTNLSALTGEGPGILNLTWTAPGDDGGTGDISLGSYRIHYSTIPTTVFSSAAAQVEFSTSGVKPGALQGRLVTGLTAGATYHARIFMADDSGNWSALSNGATAYAGNQPFNKIIGHVMKASSEGITAVKLEAYDASEVRVSQAFTLADGSGTFSLNGIPDGVFRVLASWTADDITSSVWLDNIAVGSFDVDFMLEINYSLSTLTGTLSTLAAQTASRPGFMTRAAESNFAESRVDLLRGGEPVAAVRPDPTGRWNIPNLLPGRYAVRAFNGLDYTDPQDVQLGEGETREVVFVFDPLPEASVFAFPNPARTETTFRLISALPDMEAQVTVFDIAGTLVKEIPGSAFVAKPGGLFHAVWDLTNDQGESVASGVYLFMVKVKGSNGQSGKVVKKLAVVR